MRYADAPELMTASWYVTRTLIIRFGFIGIAVFAVTNGILHSSCVPVLGYALLEIASHIGLWGIKLAKILKDMGRIIYGLSHEMSEAPAEAVAVFGMILMVLVGASWVMGCAASRLGAVHSASLLGAVPAASRLGAVAVVGAQAGAGNERALIASSMGCLENRIGCLESLSVEPGLNLVPKSWQQDDQALQSALSIKRRGMPVKLRPQAKLAPTYLTHIYAQQCTAVEYFVALLNHRGLHRNPPAQEARLLAATIDDAVFVDKLDVFNSASIERLARRLYSIEFVVRTVLSTDNIEAHDIWQIADQYDITAQEGSSFRVARADKEVRKRMARQASQKKVLG